MFAYTFELPEVGEGVTEAEITEWLVSIGDKIQPEQAICEVMTDKATMEINCPKGGVVTARYGDVGDIVPVHVKLVDLDLAGNAAANPAPAPAPAPVQTAAAKPAATPAANPARSANQIRPSQRRSNNPVGKVLASPAVRNYALEQGVALEGLSGSGRGGRITRADIDDAHSNRTASPTPAQANLPAPKALPGIEIAASAADQEIKIVGLRRKIAEKMVESVQRAPHFTYVDEVDATELVATRKKLKPLAAEYGIKLTYIPFIMKALVSVIREFPTVNAVMNEERFSLNVKGSVNIGIATDTPQGLFVPVIHNVEQKSILQLAAEIADLTQRTREGKAGLNELQGGTFTITSVGNIGGRFATPIINHPEVAILGVNQIHDRPMVVDGEVMARKMMYLSPSFDHRVIDGAVAARFVSALKKVLENPASLLLELR